MYRLFRPLLFRLGAEQAHTLSMDSARLLQALHALAIIKPLFSFEHETLRQSVWGIDFSNPVGLAAGFDKNAVLLPFFEVLGFGFTEVGSISARKASGNKKPRLFRLPEDSAIINRMGLNNQGAKKVSRHVRHLAERRTRPVGINLVKTHDPAIMGDQAIEDFRISFRLLAPLADYITLNISCPNTTEGKTFEEPKALDALLSAVFEERKTADLNVPILIKLSPPLNDRVVFDSAVEDIIDLSKAYGVAGFIASNTMPDRDHLQTSSDVLEKIGWGGLSGAPLEKRATRLVKYVFRRTEGRWPIIGVGGIASPEAAYAKIRAGASLVQLYTGLAYEGPGLIKRIKQGLVQLLEKDGLSNIQEAVGLDA